MQEKNNSVDLNPTVCQILYDQGKWYLKKTDQDTVFINDKLILNIVSSALWSVTSHRIDII